MRKAHHEKNFEEKKKLAGQKDKRLVYTIS